jgi:hypothetical protein
MVIAQVCRFVRGFFECPCMVPKGWLSDTYTVYIEGLVSARFSEFEVRNWGFARLVGVSEYQVISFLLEVV